MLGSLHSKIILKLDLLAIIKLVNRRTAKIYKSI